MAFNTANKDSIVNIQGLSWFHNKLKQELSDKAELITSDSGVYNKFIRNGETISDVINPSQNVLFVKTSELSQYLENLSSTIGTWKVKGFCNGYEDEITEIAVNSNDLVFACYNILDNSGGYITSAEPGDIYIDTDSSSEFVAIDFNKFELEYTGAAGTALEPSLAQAGVIWLKIGTLNSFSTANLWDKATLERNIDEADWGQTNNLKYVVESDINSIF